MVGLYIVGSSFENFRIFYVLTGDGAYPQHIYKYYTYIQIYIHTDIHIYIYTDIHIYTCIYYTWLCFDSPSDLANLS